MALSEGSLPDGAFSSRGDLSRYYTKATYSSFVAMANHMPDGTSSNQIV